mmetsp:Transcript_2300/g.3171  ORF Transcript_2300/g.3171 Transcript_2300/m.3171 type:complete len:336 (-) Transcript_2300:829-1836(-)|eukprot:CAMPEP_0116063744 /NCGR_PEP_ID=MMETSP0322-20121206/8618_1 /TAXON_ID=163516 /ORGANISM="Leptocylindrus danicus var. apora, Strain B651" /LENGTH=335 /DNA_ID=CAMNT_0003549463 /DNA_START=75 /DNA_END=1082 /DNA_ORIENTATION=-
MLRLLISVSLFVVWPFIEAVERPIVGVFTRINEEGEHYIAASYIKWLESAGMRAIPIHSEDTRGEDLRDMFGQINGVLFPGGAGRTGLQVARNLWEMANELNEQGSHFPIWGTCLGFEIMIELASSRGPSSLQRDFHANDVSLLLEFTKYGIENSSMFADADIREITSEQKVAYNHHQMGIEPEHFMADEGIRDLFEVTSISHDLNGRPFVSSMEARDTTMYPYYAVQWHPEKNNFEFGTLPGTDIHYAKGICHSADAIRVSQALANFFSEEVRKNDHRYFDVERFPLVWNYELKQGVEFEQYFVIPRSFNNIYQQDYEKNGKIATNYLRSRVVR